jgi:hypothetical protein
MAVSWSCPYPYPCFPDPCGVRAPRGRGCMCLCWGVCGGVRAHRGVRVRVQAGFMLMFMFSGLLLRTPPHTAVAGVGGGVKYWFCQKPNGAHWFIAGYNHYQKTPSYFNET